MKVWEQSSETHFSMLNGVWRGHWIRYKNLRMYIKLFFPSKLICGSLQCKILSWQRGENNLIINRQNSYMWKNVLLTLQNTSKYLCTICCCLPSKLHLCNHLRVGIQYIPKTTDETSASSLLKHDCHSRNCWGC